MLTQMAPPTKLIDVSTTQIHIHSPTTNGINATQTPSGGSSLPAANAAKPAPTMTKNTTTPTATTMQLQPIGTTNGHQAAMPFNRPIKLKNIINGEQTVDTLHLKYKNNNKSHACNETRCLGSVINAKPVEFRVRTAEETLEQAVDFINNYYASIKRLDSPAHKNRLKEIEEQIKSTDTYYLKETELIYGAKLAWRNAPRCIGRIQWSKLQVFDARFTKNENEMFEALCNHIKYATNKGSLRSAITIFPQRVKSTDFDWRIWNNQLISYAGYRNKDTGKIIGDPINADLTEICQKLGWKGKGTRFDILPLVLSANGGPPQMFPLPEDLALRVKLKHPKYKWFEELDLEWYALPAVSNMMLDLGGLQFTACPFNGWYMVTEIGSRDLGDVYRYNVLEEVAQRMGLNTKSNSSLWRDQAVLELNIAVLDSFQSAGVTIVDHHTASETFMTHLANEQRLRGGCPADWVWLVPPTAGSTTQVFHQEMVNYHLLPNYEYMDAPWKNFNWLEWERKQEEKRLSDQFGANQVKLGGANSMVASPLLRKIAAAGSPLKLALQQDNHHLGRKSVDLSPSSVGSSNGDLTPRRLRFKEIARAVKFTSKLFGKALSRRIKATILYATETGKSERFANKLAQTFSCAFNVHLMSMGDYDLTCLEHEALLLIVTSTFGNGDPPENGEAFAKHLAAVKLTGDTSPDLDSINSVSTNPFFQMLSEDHKDGQSSGGASGLDLGEQNKLASGEPLSAAVGQQLNHDSLQLRQLARDDNHGSQNKDNNANDESYNRRLQTYKRIQEQQTNIRPLSNVRFSVFALGSTAYPHFCAFGRYVDQTLGELGAERILKCTCGDELAGQEKVFNEWSSEVFKIACDVFCLTDSIGPIDARPEIVWSPNDVRFAPIELIDFESTSSRQQQMAGTPTSTRFNPAISNGSNLAWFNQKDLNSKACEQEPTNAAGNNIIGTSNSASQRQSFNELLSNKKTIVQNLMGITGKKIVPFTVIARQDLHRFIPEENLQTLNMDLECDLVAGPCQTNQTASLIKQSSANTSNGSKNLPKFNLKAPPILFEPGDHVGIYPINKCDMVEKLLARIKRDLKIRDQRNTSDSLSDLELTPTYKSSSISTIDFDQVYRVLVRRENMDLTPTTSSPLSQNGREDNWIPYDRLPITTIREALTRYLDITNPPNQEFLATLARLTSDLEEKKRLQQMARNFSIYEEWKNKNVPTLLSTLEEFKTIRFEPALITQMPLMKPRFYSISGTNISLTLGVVRFKTASGELREGLCSNYMNTIPLGPKSYIYGYVRSAPAFHMPQNKSLPMILIGAGTGIAPFRSFWQKRYADMYRNTTTMTAINNSVSNIGIISSSSSSSSSYALTLASANNQQESGFGQVMNGDSRQKFVFGRIELYFGCRNSNYILYKDELDQMYENGVLSSINIAFSRPIDRDVISPEQEVSNVVAAAAAAAAAASDINSPSSQSTNNLSTAHHHQQDKLSPLPVNGSKVETIRQARKKMYVQDKLLENSAEVYKLIMSDEAHVYVCGDVAMADGVYKTLAKLLSKENSEDGETVLMNLRNLNRYHEDIFGAKQMS